MIAGGPRPFGPAAGPPAPLLRAAPSAGEARDGREGLFAPAPGAPAKPFLTSAHATARLAAATRIPASPTQIDGSFVETSNVPWITAFQTPWRTIAGQTLPVERRRKASVKPIPTTVATKTAAERTRFGPAAY